MSHPLSRFEAEAKSLLARALAGLAPGVEPRFAFAPAPPGKGEFAAGCFPLAGALKRAPPAIAADLAGAITPLLDPAGWVAAAEADGPYINFRIAASRLAAELLSVIAANPTSYGDLPRRKQTVILEHTSANPNGPLHVGRARNPIIGDTLVRLYRAAGYPTEAQYYLDDMGKQVAILTWGLENLGKEKVDGMMGPASRPKIDHDLVRYYQAANKLMEEDPTVGEAIQGLIRATEAGDVDALSRVEAGYKDVFAGMMESLARLRVAFDGFVKESMFVANGDTERVIDRLASQDKIPVGHEGKAIFLDLAKTKGVSGKSTKFFFRRGDGTSLYPTRDIAYHLWKAQRADRLVDVLGEDHKLQATQVRACLELLAAPHLPEVVFYSFVSLPEGKMSTRRNRVVYVDDLLDEAVERAYQEVKTRRGGELSEAEMRAIAEIVGVGAIRFAIVKVQCEKSIVFKWEEALSFEGFACPFVQYSHARVCSILDRAATFGLAPDFEGTKRLVHPSESALLLAIARLPAVVEEGAASNRPHIVPQYAYDVASAFNDFYRDCRVLDENDAGLSRARLALVEASRVALAKALDLIGVVAPRQM